MKQQQGSYWWDALWTIVRNTKTCSSKDLRFWGYSLSLTILPYNLWAAHKCLSTIVNGRTSWSLIESQWPFEGKPFLLFSIIGCFLFIPLFLCVAQLIRSQCLFCFFSYTVFLGTPFVSSRAGVPEQYLYPLPFVHLFSSSFFEWLPPALAISFIFVTWF